MVKFVNHLDPLPLVIIDWHRKGLYGKVRFQKLVFLCEVEAKDERLSDIFNFGYYKHGPYSASLTGNINSQQLSGNIKVKTEFENDKTLNKFYLTEKGRKKISDYFSSHKDELAYLKQVLYKYGCWETEDITDLIHKNFVDFVENPSPIRERAEVILDMAEKHENKAFSSTQDEIITYSMILTILGELFLRLSEVAKTNVVNSSSATRNKHFQKWCRSLNKGNIVHGFLFRTEFKIPNKEALSYLQNYVLNLATEAEKFGFFPTDRELLSKVPKESIKKLEEITSGIFV